VKILLSAYLDHNLGDDLFVDYFCKKYADHEVLLIYDQETALNPQLERNHNLRKIGLKAAVKTMPRVDAFVMIGGSIFQDIAEFHRYDVRRNILVTLARLCGARVYVMGSNIGPIYSKRASRTFKYLFFLTSGISVRDTASMELLKAWKCRPNYVLAPDLIFSYPYVPRRAAKRSAVLGVSVINIKSDSAETGAYLRKLAEIVDRYLGDQADGIVRLFGFNGGAGNDGTAIQRLLALTDARSRDRIETHQYGPAAGFEAFLDCFAECDFHICTRFHSLVLSLMYRIPYLPIAYSDKTTNLLHDIGFSAKSVDYAAMAGLDAAEVVAEIRRRTGERLPDTDELAKRSVIHFAALDEYIAAKSPAPAIGAVRR
jgi:colanic acid/amylovoran biosynthesis protein